MWFVFLGVLSGCVTERSPGPHPDDRGKITFWQVLGSEGSVNGCTDSQAWEAITDPPAFDPYSFIIYRVEEDGKTAMGQDCERLSPAYCEDTEQVFSIDGNVLRSELPPQTVMQQGGCSLIMTSRWEIEDQGGTAIFTLPATFSYAGDEEACTALEEQVRFESSNGLGFEGCTTGIVVDLLLDRILAAAD